MGTQLEEGRMALVPFEQLDGVIERIKEIAVGTTQVERWYEDEHGNRAIVLMPRLTERTSPGRAKG